jgi:hypothetical protein
MLPRPEKCIGNCRRDISVGQTIFQLYEGGLGPHLTSPQIDTSSWGIGASIVFSEKLGILFRAKSNHTDALFVKDSW